MKTILNQNLKTLYFVRLILLSVSCSEKDDANTNEINQVDIEKVLTEMKNLGESEGKIIVFEMKNLKEKDYAKYFEVIENSEKVLAFASCQGINKRGPGDNFTVTCTWGNGESEVTECGESVSCAGQATWDCLENGGCATICNAKITFTPANISSNKKSKSLKQLDSILSEVINLSNSKNRNIEFTIKRNKDTYELSKVIYLENTSNTQSKSERTFQVDCWGSDGELLWQDTYYDKLSASEGILKCTDKDGGCADICEIVARFSK